MKFFLLSSATAVGIVLTIVADIFLKASVEGGTRFLFAGMALYALVAIPVAIAFRYSTFGALFVVWEALYLFAGVLVASTGFHEHFSLRRLVAVLFVVVALVLGYDA